MQKIELAAAEFATEFSAVTEIIVFGSLVRPGYFTELSDVDIAVRDLPNAQYWKAILWWEKHLEFEDIDLVRIEDASARIRKYITKGKTVHEE
ncbi:MAG: nucleotidyltransferase family protein [bacterium]